MGDGHFVEERYAGTRGIIQDKNQTERFSDISEIQGDPVVVKRVGQAVKRECNEASRRAYYQARNGRRDIIYKNTILKLNRIAPFKTSALQPASASLRTNLILSNSHVNAFNSNVLLDQISKLVITAVSPNFWVEFQKITSLTSNSRVSAQIRDPK